MTSAAVEAFAAWAATYDRTVSRELQRFAGVTHREALDRVVGLAELRGGQSVLDVGTGTGWLAIGAALQNGGGRVAGVDATPNMLAEASRNAERLGVKEMVRLTLGSAERLPHADGQFDVVLSSLALHHTSDVSVSLGEMVRVLKPGGRAVIMDMGAPPAWRTAPVSWFMDVLRRVYKVVGGTRGRADAEAFERTYTAEEWGRLLVAVGLKQTRVEDVRRPGQRIYPCVVFASGEKDGVEAGAS